MKLYMKLTDGQTDEEIFFQKVLFLLSDPEYIYMSMPILIISQISPPFEYAFFHLSTRFKTSIKFQNRGF